MNVCHTQPIYNISITCPNSLDIYNKILRLSMYYKLTKQNINKASMILKDLLAGEDLVKKSYSKEK